jgi:outer membrane receptor for ferrienterochelin and colicin
MCVSERRSITRYWRPASAFLIGSVLVSASVAAAQQPTPPPKAAVDASTMDLENLMKIEVVVAGSKRAQQTRDVASFVSVVTASDIKRHGYRTLSAVLRTLPSFYVSNDRNYSFLGVRGFERSGDYNSRVLLLINGLRTNDNVFASAYLGEEFSVDVDMIDRIEVIRGPAAAIYGSNAFFAVINVVTKSGGSLEGGEVAGSAASYGTYGARASYGKTYSNDLDLLVSASFSDSKGQRLYYPEYNSPLTNDGFADAADHEGFHKLLATASKGHFSFLASSSWREKTVPTGSFGTLFDDPRAKTEDGLSLASVSYDRSISRGAVSARLHGGRWTYMGTYPYDLAVIPNRDEDVGEWWGADVDVTRAISRHTFTVGGEFQDNYKQNQKNFDPDPYVVYTDVHANSTRWGVFAQDEIKLLKPLTLYAGIRLDRYEVFGSATSPRLGLIYTPDAATTIKLLAGRAFRAPNEYELHLDNAAFRANPDLEPERIETIELVAERFIGGGLQLSASTFRNRMSALISQRVDPSDNRLVFENAGAMESKGVEFGLRVNRGYGPTGQLTYSLQRAKDRATGIELTNSPRQMAKLELEGPLNVANITAGVDAQYVSGQRTLTGIVAPGRVITNISLLAPLAFRRFDLSATVYNLFAVKYGFPGSDAHLQNIIQQDGRNFRVKTTLHY